MPRDLAFALLYCASAAFAADPEAVRAPYVETGDCWSYRGNNLYNRGLIKNYELCVSFVDRTKDVILATATIQEDKRELDLSYTLEWGDGRAIYGMVADPPARMLKFPLHVGDEYSITYTARDNVGAHDPGEHHLNIKVEGWEKIAVPAGTFRALRIVGKGEVNVPPMAGIGTGQRNSFVMVRTWWYVPEVNRYVKFSNESLVDHYGEELTSYRLNK